jgi:poly-gamma-glutamate synthesis protein (capsule biosynthesis protein)
MTSPFDFTTGTWDTGRPAAGTLVFGGDWAPIRDFAPLIQADPEGIYHDLLGQMQDADYTIVNLEAPLSDIGTPVTKSGAVFKGRPCHAQGLTAAGVNGVTLSNNHIFDFGCDAFEQTRNTLDARDIAHTGAGTNQAEAQTPLTATINGVTLAVVNFSEAEDYTTAGIGPGVTGWDIPGVEARIADLKKNVDVVIAVAHCGPEYIPFAPPYVMAAFDAAARAGADAVIGHHPHVPQGITFRKNTPICCSLGNFIFYQPTTLYWRKLGYMVCLGIDKAGITGLSLIPYAIHDRGVSRLKQDKLTDFFTRFKEISIPLDTDQGIAQAWNGFLDHYGSEGFYNEVDRILDKMKQGDPKGAAMFRNRMACPQHFFHWRDFLHRTVTGQTDSAPDWARSLAREWLTRKIGNHD